MNKEKILSSVILTFAFFISGAIVVHGQTPSANPSPITFPVADLGGCKTEASCKTFCDNKANIVACVNFAEKHGLLGAQEAEQARKFGAMGEGPGGCKDQATCKSYCDGTSHLDECLNFAEKNGLMSGEDLAQAQKVALALKNGTSLPGGCKDKNTCESYCQISSHLEECLGFAEKAGFLTGEELAEAKKFAPLVANGETPGKCTSKDSCENYCKDVTHTDECFSFAEKNGLVSPEDAALYKKTGGVGPGGCRSKDSCEAYCNEPANSEACFTYAEQHDLIPADKLKEAKDGMAKMRTGLKFATPEVISCLKENLGEDNYASIESGSFVPGPTAGKAIQGCFSAMQKFAEEKMSQIPEEAKPCITGKLGADAFDKIKAGEIDPDTIQTTISTCMKTSVGGKIENQMKAQFQGMTDQLPPGVDLGDINAMAEKCLKQSYGDNYEAKFSQGSVNTDEVQATISTCMQNQIQAKIMEQIKDQIPSGAGAGEIPQGYAPGNGFPNDWSPTDDEIEKMKSQYGAPPEGYQGGSYGPTQ
ncbi:MAG: hypothetical protein WC250_00170 [Candidatus Paceibacterota bacterium]|jgi:hypothetical protein